MIDVMVILLGLGVLIFLSVRDISQRLIPNNVVIPSTIIFVILLAFLGKFVGQGPNFSRSTFGLVLTFLFFLSLYAISPKGIGMGDVKLSALVGAALSWHSYNALFIGLIAMFSISGVYSLGLVVKNPSMIHGSIPFAPFMTLGYIVGIAMR